MFPTNRSVSAVDIIDVSTWNKYPRNDTLDI